MGSVDMVEIWRGDFCESVHRGHAVVCDGTGQIVEAWGDPGRITLPRSAVKMIQALPLIESGAAEAAGLTSEQLALSCASHQGAPIHVDRVMAWLSDLGLDETALRCGPQTSRDPELRKAMIKADEPPGRQHNNCSGKHSGFLTLGKHLKGGPEYLEIDHPVQIAVKAAFEEVCDESTAGYGIDGCSAPNFAFSLEAFARGMAKYANATESSARGRAQITLRSAMMAHPELVAGEGRACTNLMRAMAGKAAIKTGAEGVFVGILPERGFGIALKIEDGTTRAAEAVMAALLVKYGALDAAHPVVGQYRDAPILNWDGLHTGHTRVVI